MVFSKPSAQQIALACGAAGAYVEVTDDLVTDSIQGTWGRNSAFSDTRPGVFSFDLVNDAGKYTPGNTLSTLATTVRVGMGVSWLVDGMKFAGTIRSTHPYFTGPSGLSGSSKIHVVCDDILGNAARHEIGTATDATQAAVPYHWWKLADTASAIAGVSEIAGRSSIVPLNGTFPATSSYLFGVAGVPGLGLTQLQVSDAGSGGILITGNSGDLPPLSYTSTTDLGWWSSYITPQSTNVEGLVIVAYGAAPTPLAFKFGVTYLSGVSYPGVYNLGTTTWTRSSTPIVTGVPQLHAVAVSVEKVGTTVTFYVTPYLDGVAWSARIAIASWTSSSLPTSAQVSPTYAELWTVSADSTSRVVSYSNLVLTRAAPQLQLFSADGTAASVLTSLAATAPEITLDTLPTLSSSPYGRRDSWTGSTLDGFNAVIRSEQGYIWAETTGTLSAPVQKVKVRARDRASTVDAAHTFTISEIQNAPEFTTDIENMVAAATARGPALSVTWTDTTLAPYVGSASDSTEVLLRDSVDLLAWAQDRLLRGTATGVRLPQLTLHALHINRWADVSALRAGDRIRVTGLPSAVFGVTYIDGWLLGCSYSLNYPSLHGEDQLLFTFALQPVLPDTAIYDTNLYMADGALTLSAGINAAVTSMSVATTGPKLETTTFPYSLLLDSEQVTVTACTSATPQVATITRGAGGTTAASHTTSAVIEVTPSSLYAF